MNKRFLLTTLFGFPLYVEASFLMLLGLYLLIGGLTPPQMLGTGIFVIAAVLSITWHELGHALMARQLGSSEIWILLHGAGGLTYHRPMSSLLRSLAVSAAGPGAGLLLGLALLGIFTVIAVPGPWVVGSLVRDLIWINIVWSLFNLLPMLPLDGGHILQNLLLLRLSRRRAMELSLAVTFFLAIGLGVAGLVNRWIFVTLICVFSLQLAWSQMGGAGPLRRFWSNLTGR